MSLVARLFREANERETIMTTESIRSREEAREQLKRLEDFYGVPVLSLRSFCNGISIWMDCILKNNTDPELTRGGIQHGCKYYEALEQMRIDIMKSKRGAVFLSLRQFSSPIICGRPQKRPERKSRTVRGSDFIICVTA
jgi:hypothetical protein